MTCPHCGQPAHLHTFYCPANTEAARSMMAPRRLRQQRPMPGLARGDAHVQRLPLPDQRLYIVEQEGAPRFGLLRPAPDAPAAPAAAPSQRQPILSPEVKSLLTMLMLLAWD